MGITYSSESIHCGGGSSNSQYNSIYNVVPSLPSKKYSLVDAASLKTQFGINSNSIASNYIDLRVDCPRITNIGTYPVNPIASICYLIHYLLIKQELAVFTPSIGFLYAHCSMFSGIENLFSFESIFNTIKQYGICSELKYPTDVKCIHTPSDTLYEAAKAYTFIQIMRVPYELMIIKRLIQYEHPVLVGFSVYVDLNRITSKLWIPDTAIERVEGGLSGVLVGYIEDRRMFIMAQTFGTAMGEDGYIMVPYDYILDREYTFELYVLQLDKNRIEGYARATATTPAVSRGHVQRGGGLNNLFN